MLEYASFVQVSTYEGGTPPDAAKWFARWLSDAANDERVDHSMLQHVQFAVFGLGSSDYVDNFNVFGKQVDRQLVRLGGQRLIQLGVGMTSKAVNMFCYTASVSL